jgi:orotidine-5'-phosphate decarboxylase
MADPAPVGFAARVVAAVGETGPLCAGIDPSPALLSAWGLPDSAAGLRRFGLACIEAFAGTVGVVKPQVAFFERWGSAGFAALEDVLAAARAAGLVVIADAKRADIGNTVEAYAAAWLDDDSPLCADAVTAVPYLGLGSLRPLVDRAGTTGRGVIVVVRSSNPEGRSLQEARVGGSDSTVEDVLLSEIAALNGGGTVSSEGVPSEAVSSEGVPSEGVPAGTVGAVIGATLAPSSFPLPTLGGVILSPGVGAQGAGPAEVAALFGGCPPGSVVANVSRAILAAGPSVSDLADAARRSADEMREALA